MSVRLRQVLIATAVLLLIVVASGGYYAWSIDRQYDKARTQADIVRARFAPEDGGPPALESLPQLTQDLVQLEEDLNELNRRVDLPVIGGIARNTPYVGGRIQASQDLLELGIELTEISRDTSEIANEIRDAFEKNGFMDDEPAVGPTWLDVVIARQDDINELERRYDAALQQRAAIDVDELPGRTLNTLETVDGLLERGTGIRDEYFHLFPLLGTAFGAEEEAHYLILLQNAQELRGAGGFVGTYGMITISNGRIIQLEINPIGFLNQAYVDARNEVLPAPEPIREHLGQQEWFPHDANWSPDFPMVAAELSAMYADTGWPELQGIVAVNDSAVEAVLANIDPYELEVEDQTLVVASDNFIDLIQSFRGHGELHKEVVAELGRSLIDQVLMTDFDTKKDIFWTMRDSANQREIQVAMLDPQMQAEVTSRGWDGALVPDPDVSTLIVTISNVTGNKSSANVWVDAYLQMDLDESGETLHVKWGLDLSHRGDPDGNLDFHGFHRTWLQVYLPEDAMLVSSSRESEPDEMTNDPRAIGYHIELLTGEKQFLEIEFDLPAGDDQMLLRRQSGLHNIDYYIRGNPTASCQFNDMVHLDHDYLIDFNACEARIRPADGSATAE